MSESTRSAGQPAGAGRPGSLDELITELGALPGLPPVERARRIPGLIEAAKSVLARERGAAMAEALAAPPPHSENRYGARELAAELGITRSKVYDALALARAAHEPRQGEPR